MAKINTKIDDLNPNLVGTNASIKANEELRDLAQEITDLASDRLDLYKKLTPLDKQLIKQAQDGSIISNKQIPILEKALGIKLTELKAVDEIAEAAKKRNDLTNTWIGKLKEAAIELRDIAQNPLTAGVILMGALGAETVKFFNSVEGVRMELGLAGSEAVQMTGEIAKGSLALGYGYGEAAEAAGEIVKQTGDISAATSENIKEVAKMAAWYGVSAENAATLQRISSEVGGSTLESYRNMAQMAGVPAGVVMADVAQNAEFFAKYSKDGGKNIYDAAIAAKQLGLSLSEVDSISTGLLDVQSSIEAEMNASVLLGKSLNLNRARELALAGDQAGMMAEIVSQAGTSAEFAEMDMFRRQAMAEAFGLSVSQLQTMISQQEDLNNQTAIQNTGWGKVWMGVKKVAKTVGSYKETLMASGNFLFAMSHNMSAFKKGATAVTPVLKKVANAAKNLFKSVPVESVGDTLNDKLSTTIKQKSPIKTMGPELPKDYKSPGERMSKSFGKINMTDVVKGALAMAIMAGALWIFGKALQEIAKVENMWETLAVAGVALLGFTLALAAIGAIMSAGMAPLVLAGAATFVIMAAAIWVLGKALQEIAKPMDSLGANLETLGSNAGNMALIGAGFAAMGVGAIALAAGLLVLTPFLPVMAAMAAFGFSPRDMGDKKTETTIEDGSGSQTEVLEELRAIRLLLEQGADIRINEKKVGTWMGKYNSSVNALEN